MVDFALKNGILMKTTFTLLLILFLIFSTKQNILANTPKTFIENKGQWPEEVRYLAKAGNVNVWITNDGVVYDYYQIRKQPDKNQKNPEDTASPYDSNTDSSRIKGHVVKMGYTNAGSGEFKGYKKQEAYFNFFIGNDKSKWANFVPLFEEVIVEDIYEGIDAKYYFDGGSVRYDFITAPGADISQIRMDFKGQDSISINEASELVLQTSLGEVKHNRIFAYQPHKDKNIEISCRFTRKKDGSISFELGPHNKNLPVIIDPLVYATFIGGQGYDAGQSIAVDKFGNAYITGRTVGISYPTTPGAYDESVNGGYDAFVSKLNPDGSSLIYSTLIGGSYFEYGRDISVDEYGNVIIAGGTASVDYPTTSGAFSETIVWAYAQKSDCFVTKLNATGSALIYSTFIGGTDIDFVRGLAVDSAGNAYVGGITLSDDFPTTSGSYDSDYDGQGAFICKLNADGSDLIYSTYLTGAIMDIAIDSVGNAYVTGQTRSTDFPTTNGAFSENYNGGYDDSFITKLNAAGSELIYSTFIGGEKSDRSSGIAVDAEGSAYITGQTISSDFPTTNGAYYFPGDLFVTKLNASGTALVYSTIIGPATGYSIYVDDMENAYCTGVGFPLSTTSGAFDNSANGGDDVFVSKLNASGSSLLYYTVIGGGGQDKGYSIAIDSEGYGYVTGLTDSPDFPVTEGAFDVEKQQYSNNEVFVVKLCFIDNIEISIKPGKDLCVGDSVTFTVENSYLSYQWQKNGKDIPGETGNTYSPPRFDYFGEYIYSVYVTDSDCSGTSIEDTITVYPYPSLKNAPDKSVCLSDSVQIGNKARGLGQPFTYSWSPSTGLSDPAIPQPFANPAEDTEYIVTITNIAGCATLDTVQVTVLPLPEPEIIPDGPLQFCESGGVTLSLDNYYSPILWTTGETTEQITVNKTGTYGVTVTDSNSCDGYTEVKVIASDSLLPVIAGGNQGVCKGDSVLLTTENKYQSYEWSTGDTTESITVYEDSEYFVRVTSEDGCSGTSQKFILKLNPLPDPSITGNLQSCLGREQIYSTVRISKANTYWILNDGGEIIGNNDNDTVAVNWTKPGAWELIVQQTNEFGCDGYDTLIVEVEQTVFPKIEKSNSALCPGGSLTLSAPVGYVKYKWSTGDTLKEIEITEIGVYSVVVTGENGCIGTDSVEVIPADPIEVSIIGDPKICPGGSIELEADKDYASYNWSNGDTTKQATITQTGNYTLTVTNEEGCSGEASVDVTLIDAELRFADYNPVDFGKILIGNNLIKTVQISNPSDYDIEYAVTLKNDTKQINIDPSNNNISANSTANITLKFTPDYPQYYNDTLIIETSSPCVTSISKAITGAGFVTSKVWLPDTTATPGAKDYCIPLRAVITNKYIPELNLAYLPMKIKTDASLIVPNIPYTVNGRDLTIKLNGGSLLLGSDTTIIANICGWIIFANEDVTPLEITEFAWDNELVEVEIIDGSIMLDGVCAQNLRRVGSFTLTKMQISPNPADQSIKISIESGEVGTFDLSIYSAGGVKVKNYRWQRTKSSSELNEINIGLSKISSGIYRIMLHSPLEIMSLPLSVMK